MRLRDFIKEQIFYPLDMQKSALGLGGFRIEQTVQAWTPDENDADTQASGRTVHTGATWVTPGAACTAP